MESEELIREVRLRVPLDAAEMLAREAPDRVRQVMAGLPPNLAKLIQVHLPEDLRDPAANELPAAAADSVAALMDSTPGVVPSGATVAIAIECLRCIETPTDVTYLYVVDDQMHLLGLLVMRDLLLAREDQSVDSLMLREPFTLKADTALDEAGRAAVKRHYPVYPVVDDQGRLLGQVRGWRLFEHQVVEIAAQSGAMVGVGREERADTAVLKAFRMRHPWLQLNLLTAFIAAFVVGQFQDTITQIVVLAAFLPVLAGQSGNTGCQALAITLRGLTLGQLDGVPTRRLLGKEILLGAMNGLVTGIVAAVAIILSTGLGDPRAPMLGLAICLAMVGACVGAGIFGVMVPLILKRVGADPATASSIFLTTGTDICGMGLLLVLATLLVL
ncbi:magnesium transporter [Algiphilus sp. W345]|uniref:Magnesium transporter n=1 Tax=Banduia mediterranea TaxID=3075609 RepID=A0ABU2WDN9_9GAMM|nr:magnesium transporter [Algiphilus sp. W345]MDT0495994.1 magnesium transporter [Algiphilus sp. W345]